MIVKLLTEYHLEFLSLKGGCTGSSESTLVKMSNCWKSHALAQIIILRLAQMHIHSNQYNYRKCITYIYFIIKQMLTSVSVDMGKNGTVNLIILASALCWSIKCSITLHVHLNICQ